ncbi:minor capsid protein [Staphylococcus haemolyticus]|uniref:minor capsid protein n=1 Tax=Staphylococcus haemolyticus TaxID=1283 RepID=UPI00188821EA|nr:minor capsid protein [Staphylococcus haemolyticus]MBF2215527.1 minor capsid protein [Staphylococcus haemolyticus]MBF2218597.1 minor capsid protein [Staphylococcus haemolyticus]MBF2221372.1 minor capsid protein [Staphylococcus haemolyticus]MBF2234643.1 minor capsid protein [Staphylococcus haemolyticus]
MTYWEDRAKEIIDEESKSDYEIAQEIQRIVDEMNADIEDEINRFYARYAINEGISFIEAKKKIDAVDVQQFSQKAKEYVENKDFSEKANQELKAYNTKMYVSREKLLQAQLGLIVTYAYAQIEQSMYNYMESAYYRALKQQAGILGETLQVSINDVKTIIFTPFENHKWSTRLWSDMETVRRHVQKTTRHVLLRGRHPYEFVKDLRKDTGATTYNMKRLLLTETARVQTLASKRHMLEEHGPESEYQFVAKIDSKTTKTCRSLNDKTFKVKDMVPGVNAPPMHPFCRSAVVPHIDENWRDKFFEERKGKYFGGVVK